LSVYALRDTFTIASFNCRGYNEFKVPFIQQLLSQCSVLCLQEHWLSDTQTANLTNISDNLLCTGVRGFGSSAIYLLVDPTETVLFYGVPASMHRSILLILVAGIYAQLNLNLVTGNCLLLAFICLTRATTLILRISSVSYLALHQLLINIPALTLMWTSHEIGVILKHVRATRSGYPAGLSMLSQRIKSLCFGIRCGKIVVDLAPVK
jgi:hypothetical protein